MGSDAFSGTSCQKIVGSVEKKNPPCNWSQNCKDRLCLLIEAKNVRHLLSQTHGHLGYWNATQNQPISAHALVFDALASKTKKQGQEEFFLAVHTATLRFRCGSRMCYQISKRRDDEGPAVASLSGSEWHLCPCDLVLASSLHKLPWACPSCWPSYSAFLALLWASH